MLSCDFAPGAVLLWNGVWSHAAARRSANADTNADQPLTATHFRLLSRLELRLPSPLDAEAATSLHDDVVSPTRRGSGAHDLGRGAIGRHAAAGPRQDHAEAALESRLGEAALLSSHPSVRYLGIRHYLESTSGGAPS